jgi:hypothetical protein
MNGEPHLMQVPDADGSLTGVPRSPKRRQEQAREDRQNDYHHQYLDECECGRTTV